MNMHILSGNIVRIFETRTFKKTGTEYLHFVVACDGKAVPAFVKWAAKGRLVEVQGRRVSKFVNEKKIDYTQAEAYKWLTASKKKDIIEDEEEEDDTEEAVVAPVKAAAKPAKTAAKKAKVEEDVENF